MIHTKRLATPYIVWMVLFTVVPLGIVFYYAFTDSITGQFTLENIVRIQSYMPIFIKSIWLALISTLVCLIIGYPVAYYIARAVSSQPAASAVSAGDAAHVHQFPAAHHGLGIPSGRHRHHQPLYSGNGNETSSADPQ